MTSLGNIALSLKDWVYALKSDYNVYFSLSSSFFGSKSFLCRVLLLTRLFSSSSDVGMKNLANSLTREGPMRLRGSSWMSCNLSVSESLLLRRALAFSACTCFVDPLSFGPLRGYGGSGMFATGGAETGCGWFCGWLATCFSMAIRCCWSLKLSIWLLVTGWPWRSLVPASRLLKECSISSSLGEVDRDVLAELLVSGLEVFEDGCELLSDDVSDDELSVPLVLVLSVLELPDGELGKDTEDSLVVVSDTSCELAGWESLDDGCGSLRSECLVVTAVCLIGMSRSGSVTFSLSSILFLVEVSRPGCLLGGIDTVLVTGLSPNLVILARLLGWTLLSGTVSETKTWDVLVCLILPLRFPERTVFWPLASCWRPEMTEFCLSDGAFPSLVAEGTALRCKKETWMCSMSGLLGLMWERFLVKCFPVASTCVS